MIEGKDVCICALLYGNYHELHKRLINTLSASVLPDAAIHVWLNQVCQPTYDLLAKNDKIKIFRVSADNVPKYKVMGEMYKALDLRTWTLWLDDDTHFVSPRWMRQALDRAAAHPEHRYGGQFWFVHWLDGQREFIKTRPWYKGRDWELVGKERLPGVSFATGGYVWTRSDALRELQWPDPELIHNGGDTLLGEAIRQQGWAKFSCDYGVKVNDSKRRGRNDAPIGAKDPSARR